MNYYDILEIDGRASKEEIERAFRRLARQVHPDLNSGDPSSKARSETRMKQLNEIRDTLTDSLLRAGYDERLRLEDLARERTAPPPRPAAAPSRAEPTVPRRPNPLGEPGPAIATPRKILVGVLVGGAVAAAILVLAPGDAPSPAARPIDPEAAATATAPVLSVPVTAAARGAAGEAPPAARPARLRPQGRATIRLGSSTSDVLRAFGPPDRIQPGAQSGDATLFYGALRLEVKNGRVTGGDI